MLQYWPITDVIKTNLRILTPPTQSFPKDSFLAMVSRDQPYSLLIGPRYTSSDTEGREEIIDSYILGVN